MLFILYEKLHAHAKTFTKQPIFYEQNRPKFKADIIHNGKKIRFGVLFDSGRDGAMLLGEEFTGQADNWNNLKEMKMN